MTVCVLLLLVAAPARSNETLNVPSPANSSVPSAVWFVGRDGSGDPDPAGQFTIEVRNLANQPMPNAVVVISFEDCGAVSMAASGYPVGITADCAPGARLVREATDANGRATFILPGAALQGGTQSAACALIFANGTPMGQLHVATADLDGSGGVGANDVSLWFGAFGRNDASVGDLDASGSIDANDLSILFGIFGSGRQVATAGPLCP